MDVNIKKEIIEALEDATLADTMEIMTINMRSFNAAGLLELVNEVKAEATKILAEKLARAQQETVEAEKSLCFAKELEATLHNAIQKI